MKKTLLLNILFLPLFTIAQDEMDLLNDADSTKEYVTATFKGTHIINLQTIEVVGKRSLEFVIQHRFGDMNGGLNTLYGLDNGASIRFGLGYSFNGRLEFGIGRSNIDKLLDGYLKYRLLRQTVNNSMPLSLTLFGSTYYTLVKDANAAVNGFNKYKYATDRMSYNVQAIIGRKFSDDFSAQISPTYIHFNMVEGISDKNNLFALSSGLRYKFSKRMAVTAEYAWKPNTYSLEKYYNSMGLGWEVETGGHVFQMFVTNSQGMADNQFIPFTNTSWKDGGIRLGFNVSRIFNL